jgi:hypothetical protein
MTAEEFVPIADLLCAALDRAMTPIQFQVWALVLGRFAEPADVVMYDEDQTLLCINSDWARHNDRITITVVGTRDPKRAEAMFREWMADMAQIGLSGEAVTE